MQALYDFLQQTGLQSLDVFWFPLLIWTSIAIIVFLALSSSNKLNPLYHYHLRAATLVAIPLGLVTAFGVHFFVSNTSSTQPFDPALFIVETPQTFLLENSVGSAEVVNLNWFEPNFLLGVLTMILGIVSVIMIIRLAISYYRLKALYRGLFKTSLSNINEFRGTSFQNVKVSFIEHPLVPFTFGWKHPVIVLPKRIESKPKKIEMAIRHELVHIRRGDYLLQLFLSVIESLFWFHPLIKFGAREIETYREISCDQEVLNTTDVSLKKYASMLYELLPLNRGLSEFSVSMAVRQSTLKKRLVTMKQHSIYKTSLKRSLVFLSLLLIIITIPIACSDLRAPEGLSYEELEGTSFSMKSITVEINGEEVFSQDGDAGASSSGLSALFINTGEYGVFKISPTRFDEGQLAGEFIGNTARFKINQMDVVISSSSNFLDGISEAELWVTHKAIKIVGPSHGVAAATQTIDQFLGLDGKEISHDDPDVFIVVEEMPQLIGGLSSLQSKVIYPTMAKRAGIEGRVTVQFIVNEQGEVESPEIIRGIGGGADEEALRVVKEAKFSPGIQRGQPVKVKYTLPIVFRLSDSDFTSNNDIVAVLLSYSDNEVKFKITNATSQPLAGATVSVSGTNIGSAANENGVVTLTNLPPGRNEFVITYIGLNTAKVYHEFKE
ncbi:MAG: TonB family protein [Balneola sp.]|nr:MAG: TonB family protein [Balneola sp.]